MLCRYLTQSPSVVCGVAGPMGNLCMSDLPMDDGSRAFEIHYTLHNGERAAARDDWTIRFSKAEMTAFDSIDDLRQRIASKAGVESQFFPMFTMCQIDDYEATRVRVTNLRNIRRYDSVVTVTFEKVAATAAFPNTTATTTTDGTIVMMGASDALADA